MIPKIIFVTICTQRTGSKFLGSCLRAGADITALGEIFNPDSGQAFTYWNWVKVYGHNNTFNQISEELLDLFFEQIYIQFGPFHFDLMFNQVSAITPAWHNSPNHFIYDYLITRDFHVIHLKRDIYNSFLSTKLLELSGNAHSRNVIQDDENVEFISFSIDTDEFERYLISVYDWHQVTEKAFIAYNKCFTIFFDYLISNDGYLPADLIQFFSYSLKVFLEEYGDNVQVRVCKFGTSPKLNYQITNSDELHEIINKLTNE
jgi:hypothetical protein